MAQLETRIFIGPTAADATAQLATALEDGSFQVLRSGSTDAWLMWITHREVIPGAMQQSSYELHVTAWCAADAAQSMLDAVHDEPG